MQAYPKKLRPVLPLDLHTVLPQPHPTRPLTLNMLLNLKFKLWFLSLYYLQYFLLRCHLSECFYFLLLSALFYFVFMDFSPTFIVFNVLMPYLSLLNHYELLQFDIFYIKTLSLIPLQPTSISPFYAFLFIDGFHQKIKMHEINLEQIVQIKKIKKH